MGNTARLIFCNMLLKDMYRMCFVFQEDDRWKGHLCSPYQLEWSSTICTACAHSGATTEALGIRSERGIETIKVACHIPDPAALGHLVSKLQGLPGVRAVHADIHGTAMENTTSMKGMMHKES